MYQTGRGYGENPRHDESKTGKIPKRGLNLMYVGALPVSVAMLTNLTAGCEKLAVEGALTGDPRKIFHSICYDPLTSAVLSLEETKLMVDEMFKANKTWLPQFKHLS